MSMNRSMIKLLLIKKVYRKKYQSYRIELKSKIKAIIVIIIIVTIIITTTIIKLTDPNHHK